MRKLWPLVLVAACGKSSSVAPEQTSTKEADALWAMRPETATSGFIVTSRALQNVESALVEVQRFLDATPDLEIVKAQVNGAIAAQLGGAFTSLADVGIDRTKGLAMFDSPEGGVVVLPIADREKLAKLAIPVGTDPNKIGELTCKTINGLYACSKSVETLDKIGKAALPAQLTSVGARGDVEVFAQAPIELGVAVAIERGAMTARGAIVAPPMVAQKLVGASKPRIVSGSTSAFIVATVDALLETMPDGQLLANLSMGDLLKTVGGPVTITIPAGTTLPDVRVPLTDPAPAQNVIDNCAQVVPAEMLAAQQTPGTCRIHVATYNLDLDVWIEGKELRTGLRTGAPKPVAVPLTKLGSELANGEWTLAFWGRGTMFGAKAMAQGLPPDAAMLVRMLSLLSELGVAARLDGNIARFVVGARSVWANPPDVTSKLLAVAPDKIMDAPTADAIAKAAPTSPFANDYAAGQGGLMVPTAVIGVIAAVALPAFMQYMRAPAEPPPAP